MYSIMLVFLFCVFGSVRLELNFGILDTAKNPFQYLDENHYIYENHTVITEDGYKLLLVRLRGSKGQSLTNTPKPPILFVHGNFGNFFNYLFNGPGSGFGFTALDEGYDVFLLNTRGNRFSRSHMFLDPDSDADQFWNYSWHEVGIYDLSATIDYIINTNGNSKVSYVGVSQGSTSLLVLTSTRPEYNDKIRISILLGPVSYQKNAQFPFYALFKNSVDFIQQSQKNFHINEIFPYNRFISKAGMLLCSPHSPVSQLCELVIQKLAGPSSQVNTSLISVLMANDPDGSSAKQALHYLQLAKSGGFNMYDLKEGNMARYGQVTPPSYNLSAITSPIALYYGMSDYFVAEIDGSRLARELPNIVEHVVVGVEETNHIDVIVGTRSDELVVRPALTLLKNIITIMYSQTEQLNILLDCFITYVF